MKVISAEDYNLRDYEEIKISQLILAAQREHGGLVDESLANQIASTVSHHLRRQFGEDGEIPESDLCEVIEGVLRDNGYGSWARAFVQIRVGCDESPYCGNYDLVAGTVDERER